MPEAPFNFDRMLEAEIAAGGTVEEIGARVAAVASGVMRGAFAAGEEEGERIAAGMVALHGTRSAFNAAALDRLAGDAVRYLNSGNGAPEHLMSDRLFLARWVAMAVCLMTASETDFDANGERLFHA